MKCLWNRNFDIRQAVGLYPFCFFLCFLLLCWAEHCFKEAFLLVTSAYFGRICSHFCSLKCANYSYFCFARSISARCVVSARYVLQIPPFLLYVQRLWPWFSQRSQLHGSCAGCLGALVHVYTRHIYIYIFFVLCLYDIMILQHHILCRFLEVGPCPPAQTVGTCPVNRAPKTITSYN